MTAGAHTTSYDPAAEVVAICSELIRIDTSNYGDDSGPGERRAAEYVAGLLDEVGIESELIEGAPGRTSLVARWGGAEGEGLLLHGHLDVVPAAADDWQMHPFSGEVVDGYVWGRGAVDMKNFNAMLLSVIRARARASAVPTRPILLCFTADEEAGTEQISSRIVLKLWERSVVSA
jgi:acetylornithine deacetylase/succinyl-diaminopimelate desuccinylase-like protein